MKQTTLCYLERGDEYLMLHRTKKKNDENHDKWIGVGGKFEAGESPEDCMRREIFEETGLTVTDYRYRGIVTFVSDIYETEYMHLFTVTDWTGEARECDEGELAWIKKQKLFDLTLWQGDRIFLALLQEDVPFFSLKLTYQGDELLEAVLNGEKI
ncbi:MAG: 8-oxo-dGTP diphosphatase [Clostridia bacterium]|nr:8-oxo-dGTP diphosphatase [Clostridia bacterium]